MKKEKNLPFFLNLETRNYINKTIQKLTLENGVIVEEQKEILNQTKVFYEKLYRKQDCLKKVDLTRECCYDEIPKLSEDEKQLLEGNINFSELTAALKRMKNNKSPGSYGYTAEFF